MPTGLSNPNVLQPPQQPAKVESHVAAGSAVAAQPVIDSQAAAGIAATASIGLDNPNMALNVIAKGLYRESQGNGNKLFLTADLGDEVEALKNNPNTELKALGYDFEIASLQQQLLEIDKKLLNLDKGDRSKKAEIRQYKEKLVSGLGQLTQERQVLKGQDGNPIPNQVIKLTEVFTSTAEEKIAAQENPLDFIINKMNGALRDPILYQEFFASIDKLKDRLPVDAQAEIDVIKQLFSDEIKGVTMQESEVNKEKWKNRTLKYSAGAGLLFVLIAWVAKKQQAQAGVQQSMMG